MKPTFEIHKIADISTKYITEADGSRISDPDAPGHIATIDHDEGDIFVVFSDSELFQEQLQDLTAFGFSEAFTAIFQALHDQDIPYVRFDIDGADIGGDFPTFSW